jgi:hypothetical protein
MPGKQEDMNAMLLGKIEINRLQEAYEQESRIRNKERQIPPRLSQVMLRVSAGATKLFHLPGRTLTSRPKESTPGFARKSRRA